MSAAKNCGDGEIKKSRTGKWRAVVLIAVNLLMIAHVIQWWIVGKTISPIEPSESMNTLERGEINAGFIFFALALLATLILGRFVCGWGCHVLALQDGCAWLMKKMGVRPKPFRSRLLVYVPLVAALYMFVWPSAYRLMAPLVSSQPATVFPGFSNHLATENFWSTFPSFWVAVPFLFICGFATVYFLGSKGFCTYACPYGGFFGLADKFSPGRIRVTDDCNQCGHCTAVCSSNVRVHAEVKDYGMVVDPGCMKCMDCVSVCPNDALYFGFGKPRLGVKPPANPTKPATDPGALSWSEEIFAAVIFVAAFFSFRGVYGLIPFLMALGCAAVASFLSLQVLRLALKREVLFHKFILKRDKKVQPGGWALASFAFLGLGFTAHSGVIRYHEFRGESYFQQIDLPTELALSGEDLSRWVSSEMRKGAERGKDHLDAVDRLGLFPNAQVKSELAWLCIIGGEPEKAVAKLKEASALEQGRAKALTLYYLGELLFSLRRYEKALLAYDSALANSEDLLLARQGRGNALWKLGKPTEAVACWRAVIVRNPAYAPAHYQLAEAYRQLGDSRASELHAKQARQLTTQDKNALWLITVKLKQLGMEYRTVYETPTPK